MADAAIHGHDHHDERGFFTRWFMSTNHKDIGILYLIVSALAGFISVAFTVYMRLELMNPGVQYMCQEGARLIASSDVCTPNGHLWNVLITGHGILMMFFVVIPALFGGFGNYFMPLQIGAPDMAFPRMNNLSFWMYVAGLSARFWPRPRAASTVPVWAGFCIRRCRCAKAGWPWTLRFSRFTCRVPRRSWVRST